MKKYLIITFFACLYSLKSYSQVRLDTNLFVSRNELIGLWQYNTPRIGNGLSEFFRFYKDGHFIYSYDPEDDTRNIVGLEGVFRIKRQILYLTIKSRTVRIGGKILGGSEGTDDYLFVFDNKTKKEVEKESTELDFLLLYKLINQAKPKAVIKINNRTYYKISTDPNKYSVN